MGIERLKGSLLSEANEDAEKITETARAHVQNMISEETAKLESAKVQAEADVARLLEEQQNERVAWARLESKRVLSEAREDSIRNALEQIYDSLGSVRKMPEYKGFVKSVITKGIDELSGAKSSGNGSITIHVMKGEKTLVPAVKGKTIKVVEDLDSTSNMGGAILETSDGRIRINLTLETLFEDKKDDVRKQIYDKLFSEEKGETKKTNTQSSK